MYTNSEINDMEPKINSLLTPAAEWGMKISDDDYNERSTKFDAWCFRMSDYVDKNYGKGQGAEFRKFFRSYDAFMAISAGFTIDTKEITKIIKTSKVAKGKEFLYQEVVDKLLPVRESLSLIAFGTTTIRDNAKEYPDNAKNNQQVALEVGTLIDPLLALYGKEHFSSLAISSDLLESADSLMEGKDKAEKRINYIKELSPALNNRIYKSAIKDYTDILDK